MENHSWIDEFPGSVTICDSDGIMVAMNDLAIDHYKKDGGRDLIGKNILDCHPEPSRTKLRHMLETHEKNIYTIEKNGVHKLIYQVPWYEDGQPKGIMELTLELPAVLPHFIRD